MSNAYGFHTRDLAPWLIETSFGKNTIFATDKDTAENLAARANSDWRVIRKLTPMEWMQVQRRGNFDGIA